jgi:hypothetical protein
MIEYWPRQHNLKLLRSAVVLPSATLILLAIGGDRLGLVGGGLGLGKIAVAGAGLAMLILGWFLRPEDFKDRYALARRVGVFYHGSAILILNTLILLVCLELGVRGWPQVRRWLDRPDPNFVMIPMNMPYYQSQEWGRQYWRDLRLFRSQYQPYVLWQGTSLSSATINISQEGLRQTPGADCRAGAYKVFVFGGSTIWGDGAPDWGTIPAYLQQNLQAAHEGPVCVVNFGQIGFVSTQSLIMLLRQLDSGNVPDLVIFYDGINEVFSAYQSGLAGAHIGLTDMAQKVEGRHTLVELLKNSATFQLLQQLSQTTITYQTKNIAAGTLAEAVGQTYFSNYEVVGALAQRYGFDYAFFWQPALPLGKKLLEPLEQQIKDGMDPALVSLYAETYHRVRQAAPGHPYFYDISDVLDDQPAPLWFDRSHIVPEGNQVVVQRMVQILAAQAVVPDNK